MSRRVFLAHAREDKEQVRALYHELRARGLDPWLDEEDLLPGQIWKSEIPRAIHEAVVFLACLSSRSVTKTGYVQNEFRLALNAFSEQPPGKTYLIPARLDDCEIPDLEIPDHGLSLRDVQWVDLWQDRGFERLVRAIEHALGVTEPPRAALDAPATALRLAPMRRSHDAQFEPLNLLRDVDEVWCPEMVVVPAGSFLMGSSEDEPGRQAVEGPRHVVKIVEPFAVGRYPITFGQYDHFCANVGREVAADEGWGRGQRPVINVSWVDAKEYVGWLSEATGFPYRLLSEAEWEYAARAGTTTRYFWGDNAPSPEQANFGRIKGTTTQVGTYNANAWRLFDMHGNVLEWIEDCWNESYEGAPSDGSPWLSGNCSRRVLRGGSWSDEPGSLRAAVRGRFRSEESAFMFGIRVARTLKR